MISAIIKDKDMTPEHIETIIAVHNFSHVPRKEYRDAIDALRVDLYRMRQPITAEALREDGWVTTYDSPNSTAYVYRGIEYLVEVVVSPSGTHVYANDAGMNDPRHLKNVATMYDLRELVRLLGGKPDSAS